MPGGTTPELAAARGGAWSDNTLTSWALEFAELPPVRDMFLMVRMTSSVACLPRPWTDGVLKMGGEDLVVNAVI